MKKTLKIHQRSMPKRGREKGCQNYGKRGQKGAQMEPKIRPKWPRGAKGEPKGRPKGQKGRKKGMPKKRPKKGCQKEKLWAGPAQCARLANWPTGQLALLGLVGKASHGQRPERGAP